MVAERGRHRAIVPRSHGPLHRHTRREGRNGVPPPRSVRRWCMESLPMTGLALRFPAVVRVLPGFDLSPFVPEPSACASMPARPHAHSLFAAAEVAASIRCAMGSDASAPPKPTLAPQAGRRMPVHGSRRQGRVWAAMQELCEIPAGQSAGCGWHGDRVGLLSAIVDPAGSPIEPCANRPHEVRVSRRSRTERSPLGRWPWLRSDPDEQAPLGCLVAGPPIRLARRAPPACDWPLRSPARRARPDLARGVAASAIRPRPTSSIPERFRRNPNAE